MGGIKDEITATTAKFYELLSQGKSEEALSYYTDDCIEMPSGGETLKGKEAIGKYFEAMAAFRDQMGKTEREDETVFGEGDLVTSTSNAKGYGKDGSLLLETRSMTIWKKVGGKYLMHNKIWNATKSM